MQQAYLSGQLLLTDRSSYQTEVRSYDTRFELWHDQLVHINSVDVFNAWSNRLANLVDEDLIRAERVIANELTERAKNRVLKSNI